MEKRLGEKLGGGNEKEVFEDLGNPEQAIGVFHAYRQESHNRVKARFYLTKILRFIFPEQIADIHLAASDPHVIVVDKIEGRELDELKFREDDKDIEVFFKSAKELGVWLDYSDFNFKRDKNGNTVYVDSFDPWRVEFGKINPNYDAQKLEGALQRLRGHERELGLSCLKRLEALREEAETDLERSIKEGKLVLD